jgi:hypothetical protein
LKKQVWRERRWCWSCETSKPKLPQERAFGKANLPKTWKQRIQTNKINWNESGHFARFHGTVRYEDEVDADGGSIFFQSKPMLWHKYNEWAGMENVLKYLTTAPSYSVVDQ